MNCQEIEKYCLDYCDNNLSPELSIPFEEHIQQCAHCRVLVDLTSFENEALHEPYDIPTLAPDFNTRLLDKIITGPLYPNKAVKPDKELNKYLFNRPYIKRSWALLAAALLLVLLIPPILKEGLNSNNQLALNNNQKILTVRKNTSPNMEKASLSKSAVEAEKDESLIPENTDTKRESDATHEAPLNGGSGEVKYKLPNEQMPPVAAQSQDLAANNTVGSSPEVSKTKLSSRSSNNYKEPLKPYPENLPAGYELVEKQENNCQYVYLYRDNTSNNELNITISLLNPQAATIGLGAAPADSAKMTNYEDDPQSNPDDITSLNIMAASVLNSSNRSITSGNTDYNLTVSGNLSQDTIEAITSTITISKK